MRSLIFTLILLTTFPVAFAGDWPQWRGPNRDCRVADDAAWPNSLDSDHLTRTWSLPLGPSYSGPIVVGSSVFVTETRDESHEVVRALDHESGRELWKAEWPGAITAPFFARANGSWIGSTPACDGERLYVAGIRDTLLCLDVQTGEEQWRIDFVEHFDSAVPAFGTVCSPLPDGDHVFIQVAGSLVKVDKLSGHIMWRTEPATGGVFGAAMSVSAFSSPVIATLGGVRQLVVQSRQALAGFDIESGIELWSHRIPAFRGMNILTPTVIGETIFTSSYGGGTFLIDVLRDAGEFTTKEAWKTTQQGYMSSPVVIDADVYLHLRNQRFTCLNAVNGESRWTTTPFGKYWSMAVNGRKILVLDQKGELLLIDVNRDRFDVVSRRAVSEAESWAHVAVVDRGVFIRALNELTMWNWN